jgi:hypothetical protein
MRFLLSKEYTMKKLLILPAVILCAASLGFSGSVFADQCCKIVNGTVVS